MTYIISDIHGEYELFNKLLDKIAFSSSDTLYVCGDVIEKGPQSIRLAKYISQTENIKCIAGNHEYFFLKYYFAQARQFKDDPSGLIKKLREYFPEDGELLDWEIMDWFEALPFYIEEDDFICVHSGLPLDSAGHVLPIENALPEELVYDRNFKDPQVKVVGGKCVFFGHTPTNYLTGGESKILAYLREGAKGDKVADYYKIHLDMGTWISGALGAFCIETCEPIYVKK